jgi:hypothetical protein
MMGRMGRVGGVAERLGAELDAVRLDHSLGHASGAIIDIWRA